MRLPRDRTGTQSNVQRVDGRPVWLEVVGVVNDMRDISLPEAPQAAFFVPLSEATESIEANVVTLFVRTPRDHLDPVTLPIVPIALAATVLLACYLPAGRAAARSRASAARRSQRLSYLTL